MLQTSKMLLKQASELDKMLNQPYGTKVLSRVERDKRNTGDGVGHFPRHGVNNLPIVSLRDAVTFFDCNPTNIN